MNLNQLFRHNFFLQERVYKLFNFLSKFLLTLQFSIHNSRTNCSTSKPQFTKHQQQENSLRTKPKMSDAPNSTPANMAKNGEARPSGGSPEDIAHSCELCTAVVKAYFYWDSEAQKIAVKVERGPAGTPGPAPLNEEKTAKTEAEGQKVKTNLDVEEIVDDGYVADADDNKEKALIKVWYAQPEVEEPEPKAEGEAEEQVEKTVTEPAEEVDGKWYDAKEQVEKTPDEWYDADDEDEEDPPKKE